MNFYNLFEKHYQMRLYQLDTNKSKSIYFIYTLILTHKPAFLTHADM